MNDKQTKSRTQKPKKITRRQPSRPGLSYLGQAYVSCPKPKTVSVITASEKASEREATR